jgi:NhaP-type Na+/H+ and K+/H+ antiporter
MFPVSIVIAIVAMAAGVEGATFFVPVFLLVLKLPPRRTLLLRKGKLSLIRYAIEPRGG